MAKITIAAVAIAGIVGLAAGAEWLLSRVLFPDMCGNEILAEYPSPDGKRRLVVFERSCGATTDFTTQASVLAPKMPLENEPGNVFRASTDRGKAPAGPGGGPELRVKWLGQGRVVLSHHAAASVFLAERQAEGIAVEYEAFR